MSLVRIVQVRYEKCKIRIVLRTNNSVNLLTNQNQRNLSIMTTALPIRPYYMDKSGSFVVIIMKNSVFFGKEAVYLMLECVRLLVAFVYILFLVKEHVMLTNF